MLVLLLLLLAPRRALAAGKGLDIRPLPAAKERRRTQRNNGWIDRLVTVHCRGKGGMYICTSLDCHHAGNMGPSGRISSIRMEVGETEDWGPSQAFAAALFSVSPLLPAKLSYCYQLDYSHSAMSRRGEREKSQEIDQSLRRSGGAHQRPHRRHLEQSQFLR
ncbi:hypothetical protein F4780DRAFT_264130 [Xylariomycetidae sp. FL0641]|nr:hypothetical protein F4780DRAFT_264130 [Xylariomycetidae sp. FL0641]